jgi:hypothetical protein
MVVIIPSSEAPMAQVTLPDQAYQALTQLHPGMTPDDSGAGVIAGQIGLTADIDRLDQLAFWAPKNYAWPKKNMPVSHCMRR